MSMRRHIQRLEDEVESELGMEKVAPRGTNNTGYQHLSEFLRGDREADGRAERYAYSYWAFLNLLRATTDSKDYDSDEKVFFSSERNAQWGAAPGVFVEPMLPTYPAEELWEENQGIPYLKNPREEDTNHHHKPDMMLTKKSVDDLPWSAKQGQGMKDKDRLMEMCGGGEYAKVADELNLDSVPTTPPECFSAVQKQAEPVDAEDEYGNWVEFSEEVNYIVKCENGPMTEEKYNRILWYLIAYQRPMLLFSSAEVTDERFLDSVEEVDVGVSIIDNFPVDNDSSRCLDRIIDVLN